MEMYEVGGCVRDELLEIKSKDIDFTCILSGNEESWHTVGGNNPFVVMVRELESQGFKIHTTTESFFVAKAKFPQTGRFSQHAGLDADFVLARREGEYIDGRRPDMVEPGTLFDDLARRDFTMNAIAKSLDGEIIDPHNGVQDIEDRVIRAVGDPWQRIEEDALRALRALRFSVTKDFTIEDELLEVIDTYEVAELIEEKISDDRIAVEVSKMFRHDTLKSLEAFRVVPRLTDAVFSGKVSLDASMKTKGRG